MAGDVGGGHSEVSRACVAPQVRRRRVLVVDDPDDMRLLAAISLRRHPDLEVAGEACDGHEAIEQTARLQPDAILLDVAMPRMDGITAIPHLRAACSQAVIVVFSASEQWRTPALTAGADAFLSKSAHRDTIAAALLASTLTEIATDA